MKQEDLIDKYVEAHADCRWLDAGELRDLLNSFANELLEEAVEGKIYLGNDYCTYELIASLVGLPRGTYKDGERVRIVVLKAEEK